MLSSTHLYIGDVVVRSFMNIITFLGHDRVPWGRPHLGLPADDTVFPILTCYILLRRKLPIHLNI